MSGPQPLLEKLRVPAARGESQRLEAALTAARYLCARGGDLTSAAGWQQALMAYNLSGDYLALVRDRASAYSVGVRPD